MHVDFIFNYLILTKSYHQLEKKEKKRKKSQLILILNLITFLLCPHHNQLINPNFLKKN